MNDPSQRLIFLKDLARIVDGEADAEARHAELLANTPSTVELLAQARVLATRLGGAGDDYRPDPDLRQLLAETLPATEPAGIGAGAGGGMGDGAADDGGGDDGGPSGGTAYGRFPSLRVEPGDRGDRGDRGDGTPPPARTAGRARPTPRLIAIAALGVLVVGGAIAFLMRPPPPPPPPPPAPAPEAPAPPQLEWEIAATVHAGDAPVLLALGADDQPGAARATGDHLVAGQGLATGPGTRALLRIGEKGRAIADVGTALRLDPEDPASITLLRGALLLELDGDLGLTLRSATGARLEARRALLHVVAAGDALWIESLRGEVELGRGPSSVGLQPGQQATFSAGAPPSVSSHLTALSAPRFADFDDDGGPPPGMLGSLSAIRTADDDAAPPADTPADATPASADAVADAGTAFDPAAAPRLHRHQVEIALQGPLATTTHTQRFVPAGIDGVADYRVPVPPGATLLEIALERDGRWQRATPATPTAAGSARPDAGGDTVEPDAWYVQDLRLSAGEPIALRVRYVQWLSPTPTGTRYLLPLPLGGGVLAAEFEVTVHSVERHELRARAYPLERGEGQGSLAWSQREFEPYGPLYVDALHGDPGPLQVWREQAPAAPSTPGGRGKKAGRKPPSPAHAVLALRPDAPPPQTAEVAPVAIVVDSSQYVAGAAHTQATAIAAELLRVLAPVRPVSVFACDAGCLTAGEQALRDPAALLQWLRTHGAGGALHLPHALEAGLHTTGPDGKPPTMVEVIYVGSAGNTGSPTQQTLPPALRTAVEGGHAALTTVALGAPAQSEHLRRLAALGGGHHLAQAGAAHAEDVARAVLARIDRPRIADGVIKLPAGLLPSATPDPELAVATLQVPTLRDGERLFVPMYVGGPEIGGDLSLDGTLDGRALSWSKDAAVAADATTDDGVPFVRTLWTHAMLGGRQMETPAAQPATDAWPPGGRGTLDGSRVRSGGPRRPMAIRFDATPAPDTSEAAAQALAATLPGIESSLEEVVGGEARAARGGRELRMRVQPDPGPLPGLRETVDAAHDAAQAPNADAAAHAAYVHALSLLGNLERLRTAVARWRDAMPRHPGAIAAEADLLMRMGQPVLALRSLEGLTALQPRDLALRERLIEAFAHAGLEARGCLHRVAVAELRPSAAHWAAAIGCLRSAGETAWAEQLVTDLAEGPARTAAEAALSAAPDAGAGQPANPALPDPADLGAPGRIALQLSCEGKQEVDLTVVTLRGRTLSWLGGERGVHGSNAHGGDRLSFEAAPGIYTVSAHRLAGADGGTLPCELALTLGDAGTKRVALELVAQRRDAARIVVEAR